MNPEKEIELEIKDYLGKSGWFVFKISQPSRHARNIKGIADLFAVKGGFSVWIEVKTHTGKQSTSQEIFQANIESHGGRYILARSVEDLVAQLKNEGNGSDSVTL